MKDSLKTIFMMVILLCSVTAAAQENEAEDNTFGGWEFYEISHSFVRFPFLYPSLLV